MFFFYIIYHEDDRGGLYKKAGEHVNLCHCSSLNNMAENNESTSLSTHVKGWMVTCHFWKRAYFHNATVRSSSYPAACVIHSLPLVAAWYHLISVLWCLSMQHEAVQADLREKQEDMDQLISTVEELQRELEKVPNSDMFSVLNEIEALRDQWLLVSWA